MLALHQHQKQAARAAFKKLAQATSALIVIPTGGGKSVLIAHLARTLARDKTATILILQASNDLVGQNLDAYQEMRLARSPVAGVYSAAVGKTDLGKRVTYATIQSAIDTDLLAQQYTHIIIDEAHLIPSDPESMYRRALATQQSAKIIGLTATPERLDSGPIYGENQLFDEIDFEVSIVELIEKGFLVPPVAVPGSQEVDAKRLRKRNGDYTTSSQNKAFEKILQTALTDVLAAYKSGRRSGLVFTPGVELALKFVRMLNDAGIQAAMIDAGTPTKERKALIENARNGKTFLVSCGVLTTGINVPRCDLIVLLRATQSRTLYRQMVGRGLRSFIGKMNCLVLDYGTNTERLGCIDDPLEAFYSEKSERTDQDEKSEKAKKCGACGKLVFIAAKTCRYCGYEFPSALTLTEEASSKALLRVKIDILDNPALTVSVLGKAVLVAIEGVNGAIALFPEGNPAQRRRAADFVKETKIKCKDLTIHGLLRALQAQKAKQATTVNGELKHVVF